MFTPLFSANDGNLTRPGETSYQAHARLASKAESLFRSAHLRGFVGRNVSRLTGSPRRLLVLGEVLAHSKIQGRRYAGIQPVEIDRIVGTESRAEDFDNLFNPTSERSRYRWTSMALAFLQFSAVPPVELIQVGGAYFVRDGHHRVSVSRAIGQDMIEAEVTVFDVDIEAEALPKAAPAVLARLNECAA